jgi:EmrB/QacA subfamily drug resistance transporter
MSSDYTPDAQSMHDGHSFDYRHRWAAMIVLLTANFMTFLDVNIVNVALPDLQKYLGASAADIEWIVIIYILVYALGLLPLGRLGDVIGRKRLFVSGVAVFTLASALCGAAFNVEFLIFSRFLQALGAAMITPQVMAIAQAMFAPRERAKAFSLFGLIAGLAAIAGPVSSGFLIHTNYFDLGWRLIFYINIPIGLLTLVAALKWVPVTATHSGTGARNDWVGVVIAGSAMLCLVFPLIEGREYGWPLWSFLTMAACIPLFGFFAVRSVKQMKVGGPVLLPIYLMKSRNYTVGTISVMAFFSALQGFLLIFVIFLQQGHHFTPLQTGLAITPFPIGILIATIITTNIPNLKIKLLGGSLISVASCVMLWMVVSDTNGQLQSHSFMMSLFVGGVGAGITIASLFQAVMRTVPLKDAGSGSGALQSMQQVGGAVGVALVSQIFFSNLAAGSADAGQLTLDAFNVSFQDTIIYYFGMYLFVTLSVFWMKFRKPQLQAEGGFSTPVVQTKDAS